MSDVDEDEVREEEKTPEEKESKRQDFLGRNRLAACKSRKKKKDKVGQFESCSNLAAKNAALQVLARSLRREVALLREQVNTHDGCSCAHIKGYLDRELNGGGIACIDAIAGRVMDVDYSNVPTMGSEDDCYRDIFEPPPEAAELLAKAGKKPSAGKVRRTSTASSTKAAPAPAPPTIRPGITARSTISAGKTAASAHAPFEPAIREPERNTAFTFGAPIPIRTSLAGRPTALRAFPPLPLFDIHPSQATGLEQFVRANSAPSFTPQWELSEGSYFTSS